MVKRNYQFEKRTKDLEKKQKKEDKRQRKLDKSGSQPKENQELPSNQGKPTS